MELIDCKAIREQILTEAKVELTKIFAHEGKVLKLVVIQIEGDKASDTYIKNKLKTCEECGVSCEHVKLPSDIRLDILKSTIKYHVNKKDSTGVMLQLPLPDHLKPYQQELLDLIPWQMDVDGLNTESIGRLWSGQECLVPCTSQGIMRLLPDDLSGENVCVIGRSNLVGKPLVKLLEQRNATVTLCHSKTRRLEDYTRRADIVIAAIGKPKYFNKMYFDDYYPQTWIDVGINRDEEGKLCGDLDIEEFENTECKVTPTPGGTGILTVSQLIANVVKAYKLQQGE